MFPLNLFGLLELSLRNLILLTLALAGVIYYNVKRWKIYVLASKLEGPSSYPLIGCAHHFYGLDTSAFCVLLRPSWLCYDDLEIYSKRMLVLQGNARFIFDKMLELRGFTSAVLQFCRTYKSPVKFWLGTKLILFVSGPEDLQDILTSQNCLDKDEFYQVINNVSDTKAPLTSLVTSPATVWRQSRKLFNPGFNSKIIASFLPIFNEESRRMVQIMEKELGKGGFNMYRYSIGCSLDMICRSSLGIEMNIQRDHNYLFIDAFEVIFEIIFERMYKLYLRPNFIFQFSKYAKTWNKYIKDMFFFEAEVVKKMMEKLESEDKTANLEKENKLFHQLLFKAKNDGIFTMDDVLGEVTTLLIAGNDTSSTVSSFVILSLAMYPEIQERVYDEIMSVIPDPDHEVTADDLKNLPYLDMVFKETLRVFPVAPYIARQVSADTKVGDKIVPAGTSILIAIYATHLDPRIWGPDAKNFNPDNFLPENVKKRHPYSYIPFSGGPRNCIGMKQGTLSVKTMLIHLLKAYKFTTDLKMENLRLKTNITVKLVGEHRVMIERRVAN